MRSYSFNTHYSPKTLENLRLKTFKLSGDGRATFLYYVKLGSDSAQVITDNTLKQLKKKPAQFQIMFSQADTIRVWGEYFKEAQTIVLYKKGYNVGTLLHELAHIECPGHGKDFKKMHCQLLDMWEDTIIQALSKK